MWKVAVAALLCMSTALADVDDQFSEGALGVSCGATLQQVQVAYPGGLTWPAVGSEFEGVVYAVPGNPKMLGVATPVKLAQFLFTKENGLCTTRGVEPTLAGDARNCGLKRDVSRS